MILDMSASTKLTTKGVYETVAKTTRLRQADGKKSVEGLLLLAAAHLKTQGSFTVNGLLNLKLSRRNGKPKKHEKKETLEAAREVLLNAKTKKACITKATPAYKTFRGSYGSSACNRFQGFYD